MAATPLALFFDLDGKTLVSSDTNASSYSLPAFFKGDTVPLEITLLKRTSNYPNNYSGSPPFTKISVAGLGLKVALGPIGTTPTIIATSWTQDTTNNKLTGTLYIDPTAAATILGSAAVASTIFEVEAYDGTYYTVFQDTCTLRAELIASGTPGPAPAGDRYLTYSEALSLFARLLGEAGQTITLTSPDGTRQRVLGVNNDGTGKDDII